MGLLIQRAEHALRAAKHLGIKDRSAFSTMQPNVQPVYIVASASEAQNPVVDRRAVGWEMITAAALQFPAVGLFNPVGSGVNLVCERITVFGTTVAQDIDYRITGQNLATAPTKASQYRDNISGQPIGLVKSESLAAFVIGAGHLRIAITTADYDVDLNWVIVPGNTLLVNAAAAASILGATFFYREVVPGDPSQ